MKTCIHQPDFFPWLGLFNKIAKTDNFIVLDNVQTPGGKSWLTRNRLLYNGEVKWLTIPVYKKKIAIRDLEVSFKLNFQRKHLGFIRSSYGKAPFFKMIYPLFEEIYSKECTNLCDFNLNAIKLINKKIGIMTNISFASDYVGSDFPPLLSGNDLVLEIVKKSNTKYYLSGTGCKDFINPKSFEDEGIKFEFQDFACKPYNQIGSKGNFVAQLSIIDVLFNLGYEGVYKILK
tara:strand:- start:530 stop:1225 length:696 start_codon:yes stop_codon:yes gene_type:complete